MGFGNGNRLAGLSNSHYSASLYLDCKPDIGQCWRFLYPDLQLRPSVHVQHLDRWLMCWHEWCELHRNACGDHHLHRRWQQQQWHRNVRQCHGDGHDDNHTHLHADRKPGLDQRRQFFNSDCQLRPSGHVLHLERRLLCWHEWCELHGSACGDHYLHRGWQQQQWHWYTRQYHSYGDNCGGRHSHF